MNNSNIEWVLSNYKPGTHFPALGFAKHSGCEDWSSCVSSLRVALNEIAQLKLRKKDDHRDCILWARKARRNPEKTLETILVKQYFYLKAREKFIVNKSYFKQTMKNKTAEYEIAMLERRSSPDDDNQQSQSTCSDELDERNLEFQKMFSMLKPEEKWYLSSGKCVDNELFIFGMQCESDHPSRSLIIDPYDSNYTTYNVFSQNELQEIINYQKKPLPTAPDSLKLFLTQYNKNSTAELRAALGKNHTFQADYKKEESFNKDWINLVVFSLIREYENGNMNRDHTEQWYQSHIWSMIESCFDHLENIEAVCGESASLGSKKRKNSSRSIEGITKASRSRYGHKCDLIFRQYNIRHSVPLEFGACEAKAIDEGESGTNFMKEGFYKLPRTLKDMLDQLLEEISFDDRSKAIRTVGFIHSGLSSALIQLDRPTKYISRISRCNTMKISNSVAQFGSTVLPVILSTWVCCEMVKEVFKIVSSSDKEVNEDDISLFDNFLEKKSVSPMPTTSTSLETAQKRQKTKNH